MKKIFLPLLALVGMVTGFTLTSCGGGSGENATLIHLQDHTIEVTGYSPVLKIKFTEAVASNVYSTNYTFGSAAVQGYFTVTSVDAATKTIQGQMAITDEGDFDRTKAWFGVQTSGVISFDSPIVLSMVLTSNDRGFMTRSGNIGVWTSAGDKAYAGNYDVAKGEYTAKTTPTTPGVDVGVDEAAKNFNAEFTHSGIAFPE